MRTERAPDERRSAVKSPDDGSPGFVFLAVALLLLLQAPFAAYADVRPLSRLMLTNLQATNSIGEGLATEDYGAIETAARDLEKSARDLKAWDAGQLGFKPENRAEFDGYLRLQEKVSGTLIAAARRKDSPAIVSGLDQMLGKSCLGCHANFRDRQGLLKASTIFMTSFINTWKEVNRGLLLNDLTLVARGARTLTATGQVMSWDPVLQASFNLSTEAQRNRFRAYLNTLIGAAGRMEDAATRGEPGAARKALVQMWDDGCLACHREFR